MNVTISTVNPVAELCERARKLGIVTLVDAAQSAGHCPVDVQQMGCDFLAFSGHKICGPTGIGVLYGRQELLEAMPPWQGGGEMILSVDFYKTSYKHAPHKFEAGTPDISGPIGLHAAMDYLDGIGRENIFRHDQELAAYAAGCPAGQGRNQKFPALWKCRRGNARGNWPHGRGSSGPPTRTCARERRSRRRAP